MKRTPQKMGWIKWTLIFAIATAIYLIAPVLIMIFGAVVVIAICIMSHDSKQDDVGHKPIMFYDPKTGDYYRSS